MARAERIFLRNIWKSIPRKKRPTWKSLRAALRKHPGIIKTDNPKRREEYARKDPRRMRAVAKADRIATARRVA